MQVVGSCPHCGAPIYSPLSSAWDFGPGPGWNTPPNLFTCTCRHSRRPLEINITGVTQQSSDAMFLELKRKLRSQPRPGAA